MMNQQTHHPSTQRMQAGSQPGIVLQRACACGQHSHAGGECETCKKKRLQRKAIHEKPVPFPTSGLAEETENVARGRPLPGQVMRRFWKNLGALLTRVRVHDDPHAAQFTQRQKAFAVTSGTDIFFAKGAYQPHTTSGQTLLAHELAHVHQQHRANGPPAGFLSQPGDRFEREADQFSESSKQLAPAQAFGVTAPNVCQNRTVAEQIASIIRSAVEGAGTDEEAIFNALTARTSDEITEIKAAYEALSGGERLEDRLRDELSGDELSYALSLLYGETPATETARRLWDAIRGPGTDEEAIYAAVAGRTEEQWVAIQHAFLDLAGTSLLTEIRDELTDSEYEYLQTLLPGAEGGAETAEDRATVIANRIEKAVEGPGTDEAAIYAALTGHTEDELREIEQRFRLLTGEELNVRLRSELTDGEYEIVQNLLHPVSAPTREAMRLHDAVEGPGTDELEILAILTGRSEDDLTKIRSEYQRLYDEALTSRLEDELSGADKSAALQLLQHGVLGPAEEIFLAVEGAGTDEERLYAILEELRADPNPRAKIQAIAADYAAKGYGDMIEDILGELSGDELDRAKRLLVPEWITTEDCTNTQRTEALDAVEGAIALADNAVSKINTDVSAGALSAPVNMALINNFNPGGLAGGVTVDLAEKVGGVLSTARDELILKTDLECTLNAGACVATPVCTSFTYGWTTTSSGSTIRLCPAFFSCSPVVDRPWGMLHEIIHHSGVDDKFYLIDAGFSGLQPLGDDSANDLLDNADSYAHFANSV